MPWIRALTGRARQLAPEALAFAVIGAGNTLLYLAICWVAIGIGVVKASVLATVVTTGLAYLANRHWTYRHHTRSQVHREVGLFVGFNLAGMVIQSGTLTVAKYGGGLTEAHDKHLLMVVTLLGIVLGTLFRFWAYRTFVFLTPDADAHAVAEFDPVAAIAEASTEGGAHPAEA